MPNVQVNTFQSHIGPISTRRDTIRGRRGSEHVILRFQSHIGPISTKLLGIVDIGLVKVSIPYWSDFNWKRLNRRVPELPFQSHIGPISTVEDDMWETTVEVSFQSHIGPISTKRSILLSD